MVQAYEPPPLIPPFRSVCCVAFGTTKQGLLACNNGEYVMVWDFKEGEGEEMVLRSVLEGHRECVVAIALSYGNQFLASGGADGPVCI